MAAADGRMRGGRAGVCVVSRGPGLSNAMIGLHTAFHDATPLVVLIGQVERFEAGRMALQEQNYSRLLSDITKLVIEVNEPEQASEAIARAFHIAESGTPGPVAIIVPEDVFDAETDAPIAKPRPTAQGGPLPEDIDRLAEMLTNAERPLIWVGTALRPAEVAGRNETGRAVDAAGHAHASPAAFVRRVPSQLRRLYGVPRARRHARRNEEIRPSRRTRRTHHRFAFARFYLPRRARSATAAGACLAGCE